MYNTIVVPVSFDEDRDLNAAIGIAKHLVNDGGRITFLHVMEMVPVYATEYIPPEVVTEGRAEILKKLHMLADGIQGAQVALVNGSSGRGITDWADENAAEIVRYGRELV